MSFTEIIAGPKGAVLHVNRQNIAYNAKNGTRRPVYTLKPNGPNSKAVYARSAHWFGPTTAVAEEGQLACGARAWIAIQPGVMLILTDAMTFNEAKDAA